MNNRFLILFLASAALLSCSKEKPLEFQQKKITQKDLAACAQNNCPSLSVYYIQTTQEDQRGAAINAAIEKQLGNMISSAVMPGDSLIDEVEPAIAAFVKSFQDYNGDFPEDSVNYELELETQVRYRNQSIISLQTVYYAFTGGAHGYGIEDYLTFDQQTGRVLRLNDLIEDLEGFTAMAEQKFKAMFDLAPEAPINSTSHFYFEGDKFYLPEIYGFQERGMEFIYPTYEIGSYADGPVPLEFSWEELEPWLSIPMSF